MRLNNIIVFMLITAYSLQAQITGEGKLDKLYNEYLELRGAKQAVEKQDVQHDVQQEEQQKCGLYIASGIVDNYERFSTEQQRVLKTLMQRPQLSKSVVTPGGYFRVHYDDTGTNAPAYNLDTLLAALDYVYELQIIELGYAPPPPDNGAGGDNLYDIYIQELGIGIYGYTQPENRVTSGSERYLTYMVLDNDYKTHPTKGINGAKVTAAHEFHHASQIGGYIYRYELDAFFYELSATAMEEFSYDNINDYYFYMKDYFRTPSRPFNRFIGGTQDGYDIAIWNIHLKEKHGYEILRRQWELMPDLRAMHAINKSLLERNTSFAEEYAAFGTRLYFTGHRKHGLLSFEESEKYPLVSYFATLIFSPPSEVFTMDAYPCSQNFVRMFDDSGPLTDSLVVLVTNADLNSAIDGRGAEFQFQYSVFDYEEPDSYRLNEDLKFYAQFNQNNQSNWSSTVYLNNDLINEAHPLKEGGDYAYPNPFRYGDPNHYQIVLPVENNRLGEADVAIYSASMDLLFSGTLPILPDRGYPAIKWTPLTTSNERLASGIYVYITRSGDTVQKGKIVIFNE